jgi:predicted RNase H-like HicB family nuclease
MNKMRRKELANLVAELKMVKDKDDVYDVINTLENIRDEEEEYYDNIPENLQGSHRAYDAEEAIDNMNDALDLLEQAYESEDDDITDIINKAIDNINKARF